MYRMSERFDSMEESRTEKTGITRRELLGAASAAAVGTSVHSKSRAASQADNFDLVILNGRVMDPETMYDAIANVGVKDGRIALITKEAITGLQTIDATGLVAAPGFIDAHMHYTGIFGTKVALRDGRTTLMDLEIGTLGTKIDEWYRAREGKWPVDFGGGVAGDQPRKIGAPDSMPETHDH